jgi:hypothetical protein
MFQYNLQLFQSPSSWSVAERSEDNDKVKAANTLCAFFSEKLDTSLNQDVKDKKGLPGLFPRPTFGLYEPPSVDLIL